MHKIKKKKYKNIITGNMGKTKDYWGVNPWEQENLKKYTWSQYLSVCTYVSVCLYMKLEQQRKKTMWSKCTKLIKNKNEWINK